ILVARRKDRLDTLGAELSVAHGIACESLSADLGETSGMRVVEDRIARCDRLQLLINNAGFGTMGGFYNTPVEPQEQMITVHIAATMRLTRAALGVMMPKRDRKSVV